MIFRQFACIACCVQNFILAQKCKMRISEFWLKMTQTTNKIRPNLFNQWFLSLKSYPERSNFLYNISERCHLFGAEF